MDLCLSFLDGERWDCERLLSAHSQYWTLGRGKGWEATAAWACCRFSCLYLVPCRRIFLYACVCLSKPVTYSYCIKSNRANVVAQCLMAQYSSCRVFQRFIDWKTPLYTLSPARSSNNLPVKEAVLSSELVNNFLPSCHYGHFWAELFKVRLRHTELSLYLRVQCVSSAH